MAKIYTKTGDTGETSLYGGERVLKCHQVIEAIGDVDELNSLIGVVRASILVSPLHQPQHQLQYIQNKLFTIGAMLASSHLASFPGTIPMLVEVDVIHLEKWIDDMQVSLSPLTQFILPGGHVSSAYCFLARAVCRRAERRLVEAKEVFPQLPVVLLRYLNRLSDALFVLARVQNHTHGEVDYLWVKEA